jgi:hypothetical protein
VTGPLAVLAGQAMGRVRCAARHMAGCVALGLAAAVLALAGLGFLVAAAWIMLAAALGPVAAGLILGFGLLFLSMGCLLTLRRPRPGQGARPEAVGSAADPMLTAAFLAAFLLARRLLPSGR